MILISLTGFQSGSRRRCVSDRRVNQVVFNLVEKLPGPIPIIIMSSLLSVSSPRRRSCLSGSIRRGRRALPVAERSPIWSMQNINIVSLSEMLTRFLSSGGIWKWVSVKFWSLKLMNLQLFMLYVGILSKTGLAPCVVLFYSIRSRSSMKGSFFDMRNPLRGVGGSDVPAALRVWSLAVMTWRELNVHHMVLWLLGAVFVCAGEVSVDRLALCGRCHTGRSLHGCQNTGEDVFPAAWHGFLIGTDVPD